MDAELREQIAEQQFDLDWDEENDFATANASNGVWSEQKDEWFRAHYYKRSDQILALIKQAGYKSPEEVDELLAAKSIIYAQASDRAISEILKKRGVK